MRTNENMEIPIDAKVHCEDGVCGQSVRVVIDPKDERVTHIVVKENEAPHTERMVPAALIQQTNDKEIYIECDREEFSSMDEFIQVEFLTFDEPRYGYSATNFALWPEEVVERKTEMLEHENISPSERSLQRGARVYARDGRIGSVDEFLVESKGIFITDIIIHSGYLWGQKSITIPVSQVDHVVEDRIYLKLNKAEIKALAPPKT
jgi:uncharacterized protein YrrD